MFIFKNKNQKKNQEEDTDIEILSQPGPLECGGTTTTQDKKAPKEIVSDDMILFDVTSELGYKTDSWNYKYGNEPIGYISAFAAKTDSGTFVYLNSGSGYFKYAEPKQDLALIKKDIFPELVSLVKEYDLAKTNGYHSKTHGLPQNFGGSVYILYSSDEKISFSDNQAPIIPCNLGFKLYELFENALKSEKVDLPSVSNLSEIHFYEEHTSGGYTKAILNLNEDGTGTNKKESKYDGPTIYKSEKIVDKDTINTILAYIQDNQMFAWEKLHERKSLYGKNESMTFIFKDGTSITIKNDRELPDRIQSAFFNIQLEITTKN